MTIGIKGHWTLRERDRRTGLIVAERHVENLWTNFGLTALASAIGNAYTSPLYLVIESNYATLQQTYAPGSLSLVCSQQVDQAGDTQLVLSPGLSTQEVVSFTGVSGTAPNITYTLSTPTINTHSAGDPLCRQVNANDTMTSVVGEIQYDPTNFPNQRLICPGGYSNGVGNWTIQFYLPGPSALSYLMICGLSDGAAIGTGNLHNHFILAYNHTSATNDVEIDGSITLSNL